MRKYNMNDSKLYKLFAEQIHIQYKDVIATDLSDIAIIDRYDMLVSSIVYVL